MKQELSIRLSDVDFTTGGIRYEDTYGEYLKIFERIATTPRSVAITVVDPPVCWIPLLRYLGCKVLGSRIVFAHDALLSGNFKDRVTAEVSSANFRIDRTFVEVMCGFRPELVDALWKCDSQWKTDRVPDEGLRNFIVTNNGSFHRQEIQDFQIGLECYRPTKRKVVLVPCAADKPYPSPLMQTVLGMLPPDYYVANATGVLGIVPQDLWPVMPYYDSGIPNEWRLLKIARDYFTSNPHDVIISYVDFYNLSLQEAFRTLDHKRTHIKFVNPVKFYADYLNLMDPERLEALRVAINEAEQGVY